ncbi:MAG: hypothetical protein ACOYI6_05850 [Christensenellales bacterium]|jgi:uncharacterized integral membrane protein|nr:hypothetical protein [Clostridiales bacterium]
MWICNRCQTSNKDGYAQCVQCSAPRNARRFGAGTPVTAPSVHQAAAPPRRMQQPEVEEQAPTSAPPPPPRRHTIPAPQPAPGRAAGGFVRVIGILLAVLLPLLLIALAVFQYDTVSPVVLGLFFKTPATLSPIISYVIYGLLALIAALITLVPGLSLWALGHLARGIRRR